MDPLSVSASVFGLLGASAKISSSIYTFMSNASNAPATAQNLVMDMTDIAAALGSLQNYLSGQRQSSAERSSLTLLEHVLTTLTDCVTTYSDLQRIVDEVDISSNMGTLAKVKWTM